MQGELEDRMHSLFLFLLLNATDADPSSLEDVKAKCTPEEVAQSLRLVHLASHRAASSL